MYKKLTTMFQKLTIFLLIFSQINSFADQNIVFGITGVALKEDISTLISFQDYLIKKTGLKINIKFAKSYAIMRHMILDDEIDMAYICGATYVDLKPSNKIKLFVLPTSNSKPYYYSYLISKNEKKYINIESFKDKNFAMSDPESNSGALVPKYEILKRGYDIDHFFKRIIYTYDHGESIKAVVKGYVDGASVDSLIYDSYIKTHPNISSNIKIIRKFGPYPIPPFIINKHLPEDIQKSIKKVLLNMHKDFEGKKILNLMSIDKFIEANHFSYDEIKKVKLSLDSLL